jgi:hypothetical protein
VRLLHADLFAIRRIPGTLVGEPTFAPCGILRISFVGRIGHVQISWLMAPAAREQGMPVAAPRAAARTFGRLVSDEKVERVRDRPRGCPSRLVPTWSRVRLSHPAAGMVSVLRFCGCAPENRPPTAPGAPSWPSYGRYALIAEFRYEVNTSLRHELEVRAPRREKASTLKRLRRSGGAHFSRAVGAQSRNLHPGTGQFVRKTHKLSAAYAHRRGCLRASARAAATAAGHCGLSLPRHRNSPSRAHRRACN